MSKHRGEVLKKVVDESGMPLVVICNSLNISLGTLTNWCNSRNLGWEKLLQAGEVLGYDFAIDFPNLKNMKYDKKLEMIYISEPVEAYKAVASEQMKKLEKDVAKLNKKFDVVQDTLHLIIKALELK